MFLSGENQGVDISSLTVSKRTTMVKVVWAVGGRIPPIRGYSMSGMVCDVLTILLHTYETSVNAVQRSAPLTINELECLAATVGAAATGVDKDPSKQYETLMLERSC
ncbi:hypothetical protein TNCV_4697051 [Trichonephila clavipes]|nr:hypothetical protein TNCV_4697051 [Trichonephila clavipes]